jgi:hypothetical protein
MPNKYYFEETRFMPKPETSRPIISHTPKSKNEDEDCVTYGDKIVNKKTLGKLGNRSWIIR